MKDLEGFDELAKSLGNLAALSEKDIAKATKRGAEKVRSAIRAQAPVDSGDLREGLILHKERSRRKGKVVYDIMLDPKKNDLFQKPIKKPIRSKSPYAYYPASQEYGFFTRRADGGMTYNREDGSAATIDKVPGKHYMLAGAEVAGEIAKTEAGAAILELIEKEFEG